MLHNVIHTVTNFRNILQSENAESFHRCMNTHLNAYETLRAKNTKQEMPRLTTESLVENAMTHLPSVELTTCLFLLSLYKKKPKNFPDCFVMRYFRFKR